MTMLAGPAFRIGARGRIRECYLLRVVSGWAMIVNAGRGARWAGAVVTVPAWDVFRTEKEAKAERQWRAANPPLPLEPPI